MDHDDDIPQLDEATMAVLVETTDSVLEPYRRILTPVAFEAFRAVMLDSLASHPTYLQLARGLRPRAAPLKSGERDIDESTLPQADVAPAKRGTGRAR